MVRACLEIAGFVGIGKQSLNIGESENPQIWVHGFQCADNRGQFPSLMVFANNVVQVHDMVV